jgi:hypothetical protein
MTQKLNYQHDALLGSFERKIMEHIETETEALASGRAADFVDYKRRAERIKTLSQVLEDLSAVVKTYLEEDEDDD